MEYLWSISLVFRSIMSDRTSASEGRPVMIDNVLTEGRLVMIVNTGLVATSDTRT